MSFDKIMTKNFEISDMLNAVSCISIIEKNADKEEKLKSDSTDNSSILLSSNQVKPDKLRSLFLIK